MTSRISHTTVDCRDAYELSTWWKAVLGYADVDGDPNEPGHDECMIVDPAGEGPPLLFIEVPEGKAGKNRIHLDLRPTDTTRNDETERLLGSGPPSSTTGAPTTGSAGPCSPIRRATSSASCAARPNSASATDAGRWLRSGHDRRRGHDRDTGRLDGATGGVLP